MQLVISKLMGGLGNQMFQYAIGRSLSLRLQAELKLDLSYLQTDHPGHTKRDYNLHVFSMPITFATREEVSKFSRIKDSPFYSHFPFLFSCRYIRQKDFYFDPSVARARGKIYLDGFWQSYKYFTDIENRLRSDFKFKDTLSEQDRIIADRIRAEESVSIHVRRGDYVSNPTTNNFHGTCGIEYYRLAIQQISATVKAPVFYIFSDDMYWAKENIFAANPVHYIESNRAGRDHVDMQLMSMCKHHIIANSSFSWWAAWLNGNPDKIVVAPRYWFSDKAIHTGDLLPETWFRI